MLSFFAAMLALSPSAQAPQQSVQPTPATPAFSPVRAFAVATAALDWLALVDAAKWSES